MKTRVAFGKSLKDLRKAKGATQEDFSIVSSRTYISMLERGQKSPTIEKVEAFAKVLKVHPLSILLLTYMRVGGFRNAEDLYERIRSDLKGLN